MSSAASRLPLVLVLGLIACGGEGGSTGPDATGSNNAFLGVWQFRSGTALATCDDSTSPSQNLADSTLIIEPDDNRTIAVPQGGCRVIFTLSSSTATIAQAQDCAVSSTAPENSYTGTIHFTDGILDYRSRSELLISQRYQVELRYSTGQLLGCDVNINGSLFRL